MNWDEAIARIEKAGEENTEAAVKEFHDFMLRDAERRQGIFHRDQVPWHEAPLPRRWHRCTSWTRGVGIARCACGAIRMGGHWLERNSRRKGQKK